MECKKSQLFVIGIFILIISFFFIVSGVKRKILKKIIFGEYDFSHPGLIHDKFINDFGFRYRGTFDEMPDKRIISDLVEIQVFNSNEKVYIILHYENDRLTKILKSILNRKTECRKEIIHLPEADYLCITREVEDIPYVETRDIQTEVWEVYDKKYYFITKGTYKEFRIEGFID